MPPSEILLSSHELWVEQRLVLLAVLAQHGAVRGELLGGQLGEALARIQRRAHEPGDDAVRLAEGHPVAHQHVGDVGRAEQLLGGGRRHRLALEAHPFDHPARGDQGELQRVGGVEQVLLVLLQVLVVGERQRVQHPLQRRQVPEDAGRLGAQQLGRVGVLLLGHDRGARRPRVGQLAEADLRARPQHELGAEAREVGGAGGGRVQVVEREVAVGHRVDRVGQDVVKAELAGDRAPVGVEVDACQRAGPERQAPGLFEREGEALAVALEHPEVGEQVVAEVHRLRALGVGVAGQRPVDVLLGAGEQRAHQLPARVVRRARLRAHEHRDVGRDLVVARARGVQLAADRPGELGDAPLDRRVDVFVGVFEGEHPERQLGLGLFDGFDQVVAVLDRDDPALGEHPDVGAGLLDVLRPQPLVEAQRGVHAPEVGMLGLAEAGHGLRGDAVAGQ